ncbi:hypothetical protein D3C75_971140 [compost metagenome]
MQHRNAKHRRSAGAGGNADDIGVGKRVAQHGLEGASGKAEGKPGEQARQHTRQPDGIHGEGNPFDLLAHQSPEHILNRIDGASQ